MRNDRSNLFPALAIVLLGLFFTIPATSGAKDTQQPSPAAGLSHVRVVRLSFAEGMVAVRFPGSDKWTSAMVNSPIQEGYSLATDKKGFAEVEFENGSTLRIGELAQVDFTQLALTPQGGHINHLTLDQGYVTFHINPDRNDDYLLSASGVSLAPHGKAEFRTDLNQDGLRVEVFDGHVQATESNHTETLAKNHALLRGPDQNAAFQETDTIQKDDWDKWTSAREQESSLAFNDSALAPNSPIFGWDDLDVYGEWSYFPGYGNGWAPYEPIGWSPYSAGMWDWYPGMGYTWISGEPWGWLPFHYGFWNFNSGMGWFWMPGSFGAWNPALVNWFSGPGWIGWTPIGAGGVGGAAPCTLAVAGCLTAVPPTTLTNREPIQSGNPRVIHPTTTTAVKAIARPDVMPDRSNAPSQGSFARNVDFGANHNNSRAPSAAFSAAGFVRGQDAAPSSIIMGKQVTPEAFAGHSSSLGGFFGSRTPIHVRLGGTMGGQFRPRNAGTLAAGPMGRDNRGSPGSTSIHGEPQILSRSAAGGFSRSEGGFGLRGAGAPMGAASRGGMASGHSGSSGIVGGGAHTGSSSSSGSSGSSGGHR